MAKAKKAKKCADIKDSEKRKKCEKDQREAGKSIGIGDKHRAM